MNKHRIIVSCTFLLFYFFIIPAFGQSVSDLDKRQGFKHYKFGASVKNYPNLKRYKSIKDIANGYNGVTDEYLKCYVGSKQDNRVGNLLVNQIEYEFVAGQLYTVTFTTSYSKGKELYNTFVELYGKPIISTDKKDTNLKYYRWRGKTMYLSLALGVSEKNDVFAKYAKNGEYGSRVYYEYLPLDKKLQELRTQAKRTLKSDL